MTRTPREDDVTRRSAARPRAVASLLGTLAGVAAAASSLLVLAAARGAHLGELQRIVLMVAVAAFTICAGVLVVSRSRLGDTETVTWRWFAAAAAAICVPMSVCAVGWVLDPSAMRGWGSIVVSIGMLAATPLLYQALIRWNRVRSAVADPGDWLNGLGSVLVLAGFGALLLTGSTAGATELGVMDVPALIGPYSILLRTSATLIVLGTAATVLRIGGLGRDRRTWLILVGVGGGAAGEVWSAAHLLTGDARLLSAPAVLGWLWCACAIAAVSQLRASPAPIRPPTSEAISRGALIVLMAAMAVLVLAGVLPHRDPAAVVLAAAGAALVCARLGQVLTSLSLLVQTRHEAMTDDLTGLPNRRALLRSVDQWGGRGQGASMLLVDLDKFKQVNDRYGHGVGDDVLRTVAARMRSAVAAAGLLARLGGDEFAIFLPRADPAQARQVAAQVHRAAVRRIEVAGGVVELEASIGLTTAEEPTPSEELLRQADMTMFAAKTTRALDPALPPVKSYDRADDDAARARTELGDQLTTILRGAGNGPATAAATAAAAVAPRRQLPRPRAHASVGAAGSAAGVPAGVVVHYQPQVALDTGTVVGVEALVRWQHPERGLLYPDTFLDIIEERRLMPELTTVVIRAATQQVAAWNTAGHNLRLAVNLSATCLSEPQLLPLLAELRSHPATPPLVLEITETSLMQNPDQALVTAAGIRDLGYDLSIDDYGTGYSSLAYLHQLPATELKLDRSFSRTLVHDPRTRAIVAGTVTLSHELGLRLVLEGVEDQQTLAAAQELGCDEAQGYHLTRPLSGSELTSWLTDAQPRRTASVTTRP